jgi:hypothetical protein
VRSGVNALKQMTLTQMTQNRRNRMCDRDIEDPYVEQSTIARRVLKPDTRMWNGGAGLT